MLLNAQHGVNLSKISIIQTICGAFISALALVFHAPLLIFGALPLIQSTIRSLLLAIAVRVKIASNSLLDFTWRSSIELIQRGWPLLLAGLSASIYMRSDQVMLEFLRGADDVGQYSVAVRLTESLYFLPLILSNTFLPRVGRGSGELFLNPTLISFYRISWILGVFSAATTMFLLPLLIPMIFGEQFLPAQAALFTRARGLLVSTDVSGMVEYTRPPNNNCETKCIWSYAKYCTESTTYPTYGISGCRSSYLRILSCKRLFCWI